ncbi:Histone deacetylase 6 [Eumeta japonica]|uniref:Histone deacetylase 6 n=1 Tax=Eumeta variegata TaxID=151549 RepID=A0A4C1WG86_EUMVA|nr:Histone deacetylase 6 [Eumeta japonica]
MKRENGGINVKKANLMLKQSAQSRNKVADESLESRWFPLPMELRSSKLRISMRTPLDSSRGITNTLPLSWARIGYTIEEDQVNGRRTEVGHRNSHWTQLDESVAEATTYPSPPASRPPSGDAKKNNTPPAPNVVTRNAARNAKIQTRAMTGNAKPSASLLAAKKRAQQKKKHPVDTVLKDHYQIVMECKERVRGLTGVVTEPRMVEHRCLWDSNYPECPERLISVIDRCRELKLLDQCVVIEARAATRDEVCALHSPAVHDLLAATHGLLDTERLEAISAKYDAIYVHPSTHELALIAAGSTIELVEHIVKGSLQNGAALVRPPGHHAMRAEPCGYCFYNNVALAANHAIKNLGVERILIVDWDVHHGQATQQMFYDDPRVLYFSIHRYEHGAFWPSLRQSSFEYVGAGPGRGYNVNVPLNCTGMRDADYLSVFTQLLLPIAHEYLPQLVICSAGYDSALGDEKGEMEVTPACYATLTHLISGVCPAVAVVLEGGYCLTSLAEGAALTLRALLSHPPPCLQPLTRPSDEIVETILNCIYVLRPYWRCFDQYPTHVASATASETEGGLPRHHVQAKWLGDETRPDRFETRDCYPIQESALRQRLLDRLQELRLATNLTVAPHAVGYVYDEAMLKHRNICEPGHVECPERILRIHERHIEFGLLRRMHRIRARRATEDEILAIHTKEHLARLQRLATTKLRDLHHNRAEFDSVYFHPDSLESAAVALGSVVEMVSAVCKGELGCGVCVVRPPGHHAETDAPSGFCLLNSAAAGARHAVDRLGVRRVLLLDWDVHHGNGIQHMFYDQPEVLYISLHRYDNGSFFPHSRDADHACAGTGRGLGYNVNIPWNKRGMGDAEYLSAFTRVVLPIAYEYNPKLVIISAGFDACVGDPLGGCKVSPECFGRLTHYMRGLAGGRVVLALEGGYNVTSVSFAAIMCSKALLDDPLPQLAEPAAVCHRSAVDSIDAVIDTHKKHWKSLRFRVSLPADGALGEPAPSRGLDAVGYDDDALLDSLLNLTLDNKSECKGGNCGTDDEDDNDAKETRVTDKKTQNEINVANCEGVAFSTVEASGSNAGMNLGASGSGVGESAEVGGTMTVTLVDYLASQMNAIVNEEMFAVIPLPWCPHLEVLQTLPADASFAQGTKCVNCDHTEENWICLHCYIVACARAVNGHMQEHCASNGHTLLLSLADLSVWCNVCDSYVDNALLYDAKNAAHLAKFGEPMPWSYATDGQ